MLVVVRAHHDAVGVGNRHGREQEREVDQGRKNAVRSYGSGQFQPGILHLAAHWVIKRLRSQRLPNPPAFFHLGCFDAHGDCHSIVDLWQPRIHPPRPQ